MAIIQQPDAVSMSGNMKKFIVSSGGQISFRLADGGAVLLDATYEPGVDGRATIDVRDIVESRLSYLISHHDFYEQPSIAKSFTATIDGVAVSFKVIRTGVSNLADTPSNWLRGNFLTWQPTNKQVTYYSPEWLTYYAQEACNIMLKATFPDNTVQNINLGACGAGKAFTCNLQYAVISGLLGQVYPSYYDVWVESASGTRLTYVQRYLYSETRSEQEQWFMFENSLGGFDTVRAYGDTDFMANHQHKISTANDVSAEYQVDTNRTYNKNTGYLDEYERRWMLDFFPSRRKYVYHQSALRPIVVSESDVKYTASDLPSSYNFIYRFTADNEAALLNLVRNQEDIPASITIPDIDSPDFSLPPRLSEYPRVALHEGVIIPAFDPHSPDPKVTSVGALIAAAVFEVFHRIESGEGGGELVDILRVSSAVDPSDYNVFSAARTLIEIATAIQEKGAEYFLSKTNTDIAQGLIKFLSGAEFGEFIPGMFNGKGARIDALGNIEATSLLLRAFLDVPEIRSNLLTYIGKETILGDTGLIASVEQLADRVYQLNMKLEEGEGIMFIAGDLIRGIFRHSGGFSTSYMIVTEVAQTFIKATLALDSDIPTPYNMPPQPFMRVARCGYSGEDHRERQRFVVLSSDAGGMQIWDGCTTFLNGTIVGSFDIAQSFKSKYGDLPTKPDIPYIYAAGLVVEDIIRVDYQGVPVREINDRGPWQAGVIYYNNDENGTDDVWHHGCRWRCFSESTTEEPSWSSAAWVMIEGRSDVRMEFDSSNGYAFFAGAVDTVITPVVIIGNANVSSDIVAEQWSWTRESGHEASDIVWNASHTGMRQLHLTNADMGNYWSKSNPVRFLCTATYPASSINAITDYIEI